jgi:hypothetical protein
MPLNEIAHHLVRSGFFRDAASVSQGVVKVMYGRELGVGPVTSMMGIHIVEGKPALSSNLVGARIKSSEKYDYRVRERTDQLCRLEFFERIGGKMESLGFAEFSIEDARRAKLAEKGVWKSYPKSMLFSRAMTDGARTHCPDVFGGLTPYTAEELGSDTVDEYGGYTGSEPAERPLKPERFNVAPGVQGSGPDAPQAQEEPAPSQAEVRRNWLRHQFRETPELMFQLDGKAHNLAGYVRANAANLKADDELVGRVAVAVRDAAVPLAAPEPEPAAETEIVDVEEEGAQEKTPIERINATYFACLGEHQPGMSDEDRHAFQSAQIGKESTKEWGMGDYERAILLVRQGAAGAYQLPF